MRLIVAGSRTVSDREMVFNTLDNLAEELVIEEVVCGEAKGADALGKAWAVSHGIPVVCFPAQWKQQGKSAGFIRNKAMANYADALIAFHENGSPGTANMIAEASKKNLKVFVVDLDAAPADI